MADERVEVALPDLGRWLAVALLVAGGLVLFFLLAPETRSLGEGREATVVGANTLDARPSILDPRPT